MAVTSTNAWKVNVEESMQNAIRSEFSASLPIFRSKNIKQRGNQFAVITGNVSESQNTMYSVIPNTYSLSLEFFMSDLKRNDLSIKKFFNQVSRIEETLYSMIDIDPLFSLEVSSINYEDDEEFDQYKKATFSITVGNVR